jgi:hypothetical protein
MNDRTQQLLESLVDSESLDGILARLIATAEKKTRSQHTDKCSIARWARAHRRLKELRAWCAEFGPGSDCR